jgi:hypothetical protein
MTSSLVKVATTSLLLLIVVDIWLAARHFTYAREIGRLRAGMSTAEQQRSDFIIATEQDKLRMALELAKHQAQWDTKLHLSIAADSGHMYLERDGALLRDMRVTIAPEHLPSVKRDSTAIATPRGQRTIVEVDTDDTLQLLLNGGTRIYASDDTLSPVTPGDVRANIIDLKAVMPNIRAGMSVYFY